MMNDLISQLDTNGVAFTIASDHLHCDEPVPVAIRQLLTERELEIAASLRTVSDYWEKRLVGGKTMPLSPHERTDSTDSHLLPCDEPLELIDLLTAFALNYYFQTQNSSVLLGIAPALVGLNHTPLVLLLHVDKELTIQTVRRQCQIELDNAIRNRWIATDSLMAQLPTGIAGFFTNCDEAHPFSTIAQTTVIITPDGTQLLSNKMTQAGLEKLHTRWRDIYTDLPQLKGQVKELSAQSTQPLHGAVATYTLDQEIHHLFEQQVAAIPQQTAVIFQDRETTTTITYEQLNRRANQIAARLRTYGVGPEKCVGVHLSRSADSIAALLAIWKAGGVYVPLDASYPAAHLTQIVREVEMTALITDQECAFAGESLPCVNLNQPFDVSGDYVHAVFPSDRTALIMYTSGSTGKPKGVRHRHRQLLNRLHWFWQQYPYQDNDVMCQRTSVNFMPSLWEMFSGLLSGIPTVVCADAVVKDPLRFSTALETHKITHVMMVPSLLRMLLGANIDLARTTALRVMIIGGEPLTLELFRRVQDCIPQLCLINDFGSTETNGILYFDSTDVPPNATELPGLRPISNVNITILDENLAPVGIGETGDLYVGGVSLAVDYVGDVASADRFITSPFEPGERLYRMGETAQLLANDLIRCTGRQDRQVKIRGNRVELDGVEDRLLRHPAVREVAVVAVAVGGSKELRAYIVWSGAEDAAESLRTFMLEHVPDYMVPTHFTTLAQLPKTPNGKLDRKQLAPPQEEIDTTSAVDTLAHLQQTAASVLNISAATLPTDKKFYALGFTSLTIVEFINAINQRWDIALHVTDAYDHATLAELGHHLDELGATLRSTELSESAEPSINVRIAEEVVDEQPVAPMMADAQPSDDPIAVVGLAGQFPQSADATAFWDLLREGRSAITPIDPLRWDGETFFDTNPAKPNHTTSKWGGFIADVDQFDPHFFNLSHSEAALMDPQQRLCLMEGWRAFEDAGIAPDSLTGQKVGVFVGARPSDYVYRAQQHDKDLTAFGLMGNDSAILSARIAYHLNLTGPCLTLDTACSSSLVALHLACQSIRAGDCDLALAGGAAVYSTPNLYITSSKLGMLSSDGKCHTFDNQANGFVPGECVAFVVLKRLSAAVADGNPIYGLIRGSGVNQDGKTNGITAPCKQSQRDLELTVYRSNNIDPKSITLVEAHGTGTKLGDPIEVRALTEAFGELDGNHNFCALGSVKTNIGHAVAGAGIAGLIKALLALHHRQIPPSLNYEQPNEYIDFANSPFYVNKQLRDWQSAEPRRAAISSFGFSGTNAHVVLEEAPTRPMQQPVTDGIYLVPISAQSPRALNNQLQRLANWLKQHDGVALPSLAYTLGCGRTHFECRQLFVVRDVAQLRDQIVRVCAGETPQSERHSAEVMAAAQAYLAGETVDFGRFFATKPAKISLPAYAFDTQSFWLEAPHLTAKETVRANDPRFHIQDHQVNGKAVLPGAVIAELLRQSVGQSTLQNLAWVRPCLPEDELHVRFDEQTRQIDIGTYTLDQFVVHARAQATNATPYNNDERLDLQAITRRCPHHLTNDAFYTAFATMGVQYGAAYRPILSLKHNATEVLAELQRPAVCSPITPETWHPTLLDGAFQAVLALQIGKEQAARLPVSVGRLTLLETLPDRCFVHVTTAATDTYNLTIADAQGQVVASIEGFRQISRVDEGETHLLTPRLVAQPIVSQQRVPNALLLFAEKADEAFVAATRLQVPHCTVVWADNQFAVHEDGSISIRPNHAADYQHLVAQLNQPPDAIWHLWGQQPFAPEQIDAQLERTFYSVTALTQTLLARWSNRSIELLFVAREQPLHQAVVGFARSLTQETASLTFRVVTYEADRPTVAQLLAECGQPEAYIRYTEAERNSVRFEPLSSRETTTSLRSGGAYVITGGAGGVGFVVAQHLARQWQARLALIGRSAPNEHIRQKLAALRGDGAQVIYLQADVTQSAEITTALQTVRNTFGQIHGVFHSAGIVRDRLLVSKERTEMQTVIAPKLHGTLNLVEATEADSLDFLALFSSIAAVIGNRGQCDYAFANQFVDAYAAWHSRNIISINWPYWADGGMKIDAQTLRFMERNYGMLPLSSTTACQQLERVLAHGVSQVAIFQTRPDSLQKLFAEPAQQTASQSSIQPTALIGRLLPILRDMAADLLRASLQDITFDGEMSEFGLDSINMMEFTNTLNERFSLELTPTVFLEQLTLNDLASYLSTQHTDVLSGQFFDRVSEEPPLREAHTPVVELSPTSANDEPIAIVGMDGRFPGSADLDQFWQHLTAGNSLLTEVPASRWDWRDYWGDPHAANQTRTKWGGFIDDVAAFDAAFFNISPSESAQIDPQQRLFLQTVWRTIEEAGYRPSSFIGSKTGVYVGAFTRDYAYMLHENGIHEAHTTTGTDHALLANRVSYLLDLRGPSEAIDTACSSAIVAIHHAVRALRHGEIDQAIVGAVNLLLHPAGFVRASKAGMLATSDRVRSFDQKAEGYLRGEGVGAVLLKPLSAAERDGDHIYALIRGSAVNHSGHGYSLTAPNPTAQCDVIRAAYEDANVDPSTVRYIEAHGTATHLGDAAEFEAYRRAFSTGERVGIGTLKPNIGHLEAASGIASLIKLLLAYKHGTLPPMIAPDTLNSEIDVTDSPFYFMQQAEAWSQDEQPARSSLHTYGFGGTNAHLVLEGYRPKTDPHQAAPPYVFPLSAKTQAGLARQVQTWRRFVDRSTDAELAQMSATLQIGRDAYTCRYAVVAETATDLRQQLDSYQPTSTQSLAPHLLTQAVETALATRDWRALAQLWQSGAKVTWERLYTSTPVLRASLPTYAFERQTHWLTETVKTPQHPIQAVREEEASHPADPVSICRDLLSDLLGVHSAEIEPSVDLAEYGLDSIMLLKFKYMLEQRCGVALALTDLNQQTTINDIAILLGQPPLELPSDSPQISSHDVDAPFPLTDLQGSFLSGRYFSRSTDQVGCHVYCEFETQEIVVEQLEQAWQRIVERHPMLRVVINKNGTQQTTTERPDRFITVHDQRTDSTEQVEAHLLAMRRAMAQRVYAAGEWPLFDIALSLLPANQAVIHFSIDEWIADAASIELLLREWYQLYHEPASQLEPLTYSFRDFVAQSKAQENTPAFERDLAYWCEKLSADLHAPELPRSASTTAPQTAYPRRRVQYALDAQTWAALKTQARTLNVSPSTVLLTLFTQTLADYSHNASYALVMTFFNRLPLNPQIEQVVGPFVSTNLFHVTSIDGEDGAAQAQRFHAQLLRDLDHNGVSGIRALRELKRLGKAQPNSALPIVFTSMLGNLNQHHGASWWDYMRYGITQTPQVYLDHQMMERDGQLVFNWDYADGYFAAELIDEMFADYCRRLTTYAANPQRWHHAQAAVSPAFPLTELQQAYLLGKKISAGSASVIYQEFECEQLTLARLERAWSAVLARHDMLRVQINGTGQTIEPISPILPLSVVDLRGMTSAEQKQTLADIRTTIANAAAQQTPYLDLRVTRLTDRFIVHLCIDILIADGVSVHQIYKDLGRAYIGEALPPLPVRFVDLVRAQQMERQSVAYTEAQRYWQTKMPALPMGLHAERPTNGEPQAQTAQLSHTEWQAFCQQARQMGLTPNVALLTAYADALLAHTNESSATIVVVNWDRPAEVAEVVGELATLAWIEIRPMLDQTFAQRGQYYAKQLERDLQYRAACGLSGLRRQPHRAFPVVFTMPVDEQPLPLPNGWQVGDGFSRTPQVGLDCVTTVTEAGVQVRWDSNTEFIPPDQLQALFETFVRQLTAKSMNVNINRPNRPISDPTLDNIVALFERTVERYGEKVACTYEGEQLTYSELNRRANQLAHYLRQRGVRAEQRVGLCVDRSLDTVVGILGILKAGGGYVPLDPTSPPERLAFIIADAEMDVVVTQQTLLERLGEHAHRAVCLDRDATNIAASTIYNLNDLPKPTQLAYVIYTSGSTGKPKGVLVQHDNVVRLFQQTDHWFHFDETDVWTLFHSYAFDFSVWEIWGALLFGGRLVVVPHKVSRSFDKFYTLLEREQVTILNQTPTAFYQLIRAEDRRPHMGNLALRTIIFGGEALEFARLRAWFERHGDQTPQLVNMYGITETTVHVTYRPLTMRDVELKSSLIGEPIPDLELLILDENLRPCADDEVGELYVGGAGLTRGYLNRPELTASRFVQSPFDASSSARLYRTGDLARRQPNGEVAYIGRIDNQVQLRGFRVELGEIEVALLTHPQVADCVVRVQEADSDDPKIVAYIVPTADGLPSTAQLRQHVTRTLPDYMAPNVTVPLTAIPLTLNGKLDQRALPWPVTGERPQSADPLPKLRQILAELLHTAEPLDPDADLFTLGATSLTIIALADALQAAFGVEIPVERFLDAPTLNELVAEIRPTPPTPAVQPDGVLVSLQNKLSELLHTDIDDIDRDLFVLGATSLTVIELADWITTQWGCEIPVETFLDAPTVREIAERITPTTPSQPVIDLVEIGRLFSLLQPTNVEGRSTYLYASAGGKYATQLYLAVAEGAVSGLRAGLYRYCVDSHSLSFINAGQSPTGVRLFLTSNGAELSATYGALSQIFGVLDGGYLSELLMRGDQKSTLQLRPLSQVDSQTFAALGLQATDTLVRAFAIVPSSDAGGKSADVVPTYLPTISNDTIELISGVMPYQKPQPIQEQQRLSTGERTPLPHMLFDVGRYRNRTCQRVYQSQQITRDNFYGALRLLTTSQPSLDALIDVYVHVKAGAVGQLADGIYRYVRRTDQLHAVEKQFSTSLTRCHTPFNRPHVDKAGFGIYLIADHARARREMGEKGVAALLLAAGELGQQLLTAQAQFDLGIVPIGGLNFDRLRSDMKLSASHFVLHSFVGGHFARTVQVIPSSDHAPQTVNDAPTPVAVIGMSGRYPDADDLNAFWRNLNAKRCAIRETDRWSAQSAELYSTAAGYLDDIDQFDPLLFNLSGAEARTLDPQERLMLQEVWRAIENAGYTPEGLRKSAEKIGVFVGAMWGDYQLLGLEQWQQEQVAHAVSMHSAIANRISHTFDFQGPSIAINTSCSSGLTALHTAMESLRRRECDVAVVGSVNIMSHPYHQSALCHLGLVAQDGRSLAFSKSGSGLVPGEGVGVMVLRLQPAAEQKRDRIQALLRLSMINHYGRTQQFGMPNTEAQTRLLVELLTAADIDPSTISYIEAAATGSALADASEIKAVNEAFRQLDRNNSTCLLGSVKPNIGHLESASAFSQLAKVILQMQHHEIAPTLFTEPINPLLKLADTPFAIATERQKWQGAPHRALIHSFGATGSGGALLVESYETEHLHYGEGQGVDNLFVLSAMSSPQLRDAAKKLHGHLHAVEDEQLEQLAYTLQIGRVGMLNRLAIIADSIQTLRATLAAYLAGEHRPNLLTTPAQCHAATDSSTYAIAGIWLAAETVDWEAYWQRKPQRCELPTYPFATESYWLESTHEDEIPAVTSLQANDLQTKAVQYLLTHFADVMEIPVGKLDPTEPFEAYGLTSLLMTRLTARLETQIGALPATLFLWNQTLKGVAEQLVTLKPDVLAQLFDLSEEQPTQCVSVQTPVLPTRINPANDDIAIIGVSGRYPAADNIDTLWANLQNGVDAITEIPAERWDAHALYSADRNVKGAIHSIWGGFIDDFDRFDAAFFNISPRECELIDPQERIFMETVWSAFEDAGYTRQTLKQQTDGEVGVYVGAMYNEYQLHGAAETLHGNTVAVGSSPGSIANRISYLFDFHGPSLTLDTMCSSALTGLHLAVSGLRQGETRIAVVGGVNLSLHPNKYLMLSQMKMLASDGRCRAFGADGDGFVPGEGVGAVILKPLSQAVADRDNIYAVIKGTAINNDGKTNGYTVPNPVAQSNLIARTLQRTGIDPATIGVVEAHGTGTSLGDPIEVEGLTRAFRQKTDKTQFCALSSIKSNIGHCEAAAGIAGLTKAVLQLKHRQIVPSLHAGTPNPNIDFGDSPFFVPQRVMDWSHDLPTPRRATVSSFGSGGVNAYLILEEAPPVVTVAENREPQLILLSARNVERLRLYAERLANHLRRSSGHVKQFIAKRLGVASEMLDSSDTLHELGMDFVGISALQSWMGDANCASADLLDPHQTIAQIEAACASPADFALVDIAHTLQTGREAMAYRWAFVATSVADMVEQIDRFLAGQSVGWVTASECEKPTAEMIAQAVLRAERGQYNSLAELWVSGADVAWCNDGAKCSLPTYPFDRRRYWVPNANVERPFASVERSVETDEVMVISADTPLVTAVRQIVSVILKFPIAEITLDEPLETLGFDSLTLSEFVQQLNQRYSTTLTLTELFEMAQPTLSDIVTRIETQEQSYDEVTEMTDEQLETLFMAIR